MKQLAIFSPIFFCILFFLQTAEAMRVYGKAGLIQLPDEYYHRVGHEAGFGTKLSGDGEFIFSGGKTVSFGFSGFAQEIYFASLDWKYKSSSRALAPYFGLGLGAFGDYIKNGTRHAEGTVPHLKSFVGLSWGGDSFGLVVQADLYAGVIDVRDFATFVVWPMVNTMAGLYVGY